jgi:integration host factor subunit beta
MIRSELVSKLQHYNPSLNTMEIEHIIDCFFNSIAEQLANGGRVELRGLGVFSSRTLLARMGRNPRTGLNLAIGERRSLHFKPGKRMLDVLNEK